MARDDVASEPHNVCRGGRGTGSPSGPAGRRRGRRTRTPGPSPYTSSRASCRGTRATGDSFASSRASCSSRHSPPGPARPPVHPAPPSSTLRLRRPEGSRVVDGLLAHPAHPAHVAVDAVPVLLRRGVLVLLGASTEVHVSAL